MSTIRASVAIAAYIAAIAAANALTARFGIVPVGFGLMATAGTYAAGIALGARDVVQDAVGRRAVTLTILIGTGLSWWLSSPRLAIASGVAFGISEAADFAVYSPLRGRGWARAVLASNVAGAVADTFTFLWLAGFPVAAASVGGQLAGKLLWASLLPVLAVLMVRHALLREPVNSAGA